MLRLLANLLDVARLEANRFELTRARVKLGELIAGLISQRRMIAKTREVTLRLAADSGVSVSADVDLLTRTIENLFDNALRYAPAGGRIEVDVGASGACAQIKIGNTGPAVPAHLRDRIFEKYGQASSTGGRMNLGLGLYFCRLVAEAHRGRIWVEETPTLPTVFGVELPT